jgi:alkylation response protein AidB-like acyl-CoA dehydrogenase
MTGTETIAYAARRVAQVAGEHAADVDAEGRWPNEAWAALVDNGLAGLMVPADLGGPGGDLHRLAEAAVLVAGGCASTALAWVMHCQQVAAVMRHAEPDLRREVAATVLGGGYLASVTTEPGAGRSPMRAATALATEADSVSFERQAPLVTGLGAAAGFLVTLRSGDEAAETDVSLVYAGRDAVVLDPTGSWSPLGMRGAVEGPVTIRGRVSASNLVGGVGGFRGVATQTFIPTIHVGWAAGWLGVARSALSRTLSMLRSSGRAGAISRSEPALARLGGIRAALDTVSALLWSTVAQVQRRWLAGESLDRGDLQIQFNSLKVVAAEQCYRAVDQLFEIVGLESGYLGADGGALARAARDLRSASLNVRNDRLLATSGALALLDQEVHLLHP